MNGRTFLLAIALTASVAALSGCSNGQPRFKGIDAYDNATETNTYGPLPGMDPYSFGGTAYATGGLDPGMSYGTGADDPFDGNPKYFSEVQQVNGPNTPPVDWAGNGQLLDSSGIVVPEPPKPIPE